ncbi:hypothetical protein KPH14_008891, partial [Odynerus spinipes]
TIVHAEVTVITWLWLKTAHARHSQRIRRRIRRSYRRKVIILIQINKKLKQFREAVLKVEDRINLANDPAIYEKLSNSDKIKFNLLMSYGLNSLFWMYLRTEGFDPTKHQIKNENDRLKKSMVRAKQINDRNTLMPRVDKNAAQRFVRNGLWQPKVNEKDENRVLPMKRKFVES